MLPKKNRLNKKLFDETFRKSRTYHSDSLYLKLSELEEKDDIKFAFVVPTKTSKKAAERNKLRRQGYNTINKYLDDIKKGYVVIFFIKKDILEKKYKDFEKEIVLLLKKANILNKENPTI
ncbi:ribonuclease P protein component [Patescibacteria group bacterium]|nr:ribonuclease P protein component [Patescibacteria group bacterium]